MTSKGCCQDIQPTQGHQQDHNRLPTFLMSRASLLLTGLVNDALQVGCGVCEMQTCVHVLADAM